MGTMQLFYQPAATILPGCRTAYRSSEESIKIFLIGRHRQHSSFGLIEKRFRSAKHANKKSSPIIWSSDSTNHTVWTSVLRTWQVDRGSIAPASPMLIAEWWRTHDSEVLLRRLAQCLGSSEEIGDSKDRSLERNL